MKRLMIAVFAMTTLSLGAGCGKKGNDVVGKMNGFKAQMCACAKDKDPAACATKVSEAEDKWEESIEKTATEADEDKAEPIKKEMRACQDAIEAK